MSNTPESNPEKYLREIRDIQLQNLEILKKLTEYEESKISRGRWAIGGKILGTMLPYLLSIALVWGFYAKIEDLTTSVTDTVKNLPKSMSIDISGKWNKVTDNISDKTENIKESISDKWKTFREKK